MSRYKLNDPDDPKGVVYDFNTGRRVLALSVVPISTGHTEGWTTIEGWRRACYFMELTKAKKVNFPDFGLPGTPRKKQRRGGSLSALGVTFPGSLKPRKKGKTLRSLGIHFPGDPKRRPAT